MSKTGNQNNNKELEHLFSKSKANEKELDDFEKEALEGFALLNNEAEAIELKAELDKKTEPLFTKNAGKKPFAVWYAAAALVLITGLSVYFIKQEALENVKPGLAINKEPEMQESIANLEVPENSFSPADSQNKNEETGMGSGLTKTASTDDVKEVENTPMKKSPKSVVLEEAVSEAPVAANENLQNEDIPAMALSNSPETEEKKVIVPGETSKAVISNSSVNYNTAPSSSQSSPGAFTGNYSFKNAAEPANESIVVSEVTAKRKALKENESKKDVSKPEAKPVSEASVYYTGGLTALNSDLKNLLAKENISKTFTATINVNQQRKVVSADLSGSNSLSKTERKKVQQLLLTLDKFTFPPEDPASSIYILKINYVP